MTEIRRYGYSNPPARNIEEAYEGLVSGNGDLLHDLRPILLDMVRRINELEEELGSYRDQANSGSDEGH